MIVLLSPAKTLNFNCNTPYNLNLTKPEFSDDAWQLITNLKKLSISDIEKLMHVSYKLAELNYNRFQNFDQDYKNAKPCFYVYNGDVYDGIDVENYSNQQLEFANNAIKIISGLYGILKPLDLIQAYRLEMSVSLKNIIGKNLYDFWGEKITQSLNKEKSSTIINLASQEYSSAIITEQLDKRIINIHFKERIKNEYKVVGIHAKKARGEMANFIVTNLIKDYNEIKDFNVNNYNYCLKSSTLNDYVFIRN